MWWLFLACTNPTPGDSGTVPPTPEERFAELRAPGPFAVGYRETEVRYTPVMGEERTLRTAIWYPSATTDGDDVRYRGVFEAPGVLDAPEVASGDFPVLAFSHGTGGFAENSGRVCAHWASHGWIVVSPDHTTDTTFDGEPRTTPIYAWRTSDVGAAIDHVYADAALGPVANAFVMGMGHSFGGYTMHALGGATYSNTVLEACLDGSDTSNFCTGMTEDWATLFRAGFRDDRIRGIVNMAPGDRRLFDEGLADVEVPVLHLTGELDANVGPDNDPIWSFLDHPDDLRVHLPHGGHSTFTDFAGTVNTADTEIDAATGWDITITSSLVWSAWTMFADAPAGEALEGEWPWGSEAVRMRHDAE